MRLQALQDEFVRAMWRVFATVLLLMTPLALFDQWVLRGNYAGLHDAPKVLAWLMFCRLLAYKWPTPGVVLYLLGIVGLSPVLLSGFWSLGFAHVLNPMMMPVLCLGVLLGGVGSLGGALLAVAVFVARGEGWPDLVRAVIFLGSAVAFGDFIHRLALMTDRLQRQLEHSNAQMQQMARMDALTQLPNRLALQEEFPALAKEPGLVLSVWDLDGLKEVNDTAGHVAGDAYLNAFVGALRIGKYPKDHYYRIGGDEFVGLHRDLDQPDVLIGRVKAAFTQVSVGWVLVAGRTLDSAVQEADDKMYAEKQVHHQGRPVFEVN